MHFTAGLTLLILALGMIYLLDLVIWAPIRRRQLQAMPASLQFVRSILPLLLVIVLIRTFWIEPFRIPSESLNPTLMVGDLITVNKYIYGLRDPLTNTKWLAVSEPKIGDIVVFRWPVDPSIYFIKRVIGRPGDIIDYVNKQLTINGHVIPQTLNTTVKNLPTAVQEKQENLLGLNHEIYINTQKTGDNIQHLVVPKGYYFVMGDNRDNSIDSRYWGFMPESALVGKATRIWFSINAQAKIQWQRLGQVIH